MIATTMDNALEENATAIKDIWVKLVNTNMYNMGLLYTQFIPTNYRCFWKNKIIIIKKSMQEIYHQKL